MKKKTKLVMTLAVVLVFTLLITACQAQKNEANPDQTDGGSEKVDYKVIGSDFGEFTTKDLEGNEITQKVFSDKDVNLIFLWGTG